MEDVQPADKVSAAFLKCYFYMLTSMPHKAHRLYVDASVVSRPAPDGTMMSFTSVEAINKHILSCGYEGTTFELLRIDSHNTLENGIFINVIGFLNKKDNLERKFSQMFYLTRQNYVYFILNDIFRYVEPSTRTNLPVVESVPETEVAKPFHDEINKTLQPINKTDADDENWVSINADDVKNAHAKVTETAPPPRLDGTQLRLAIAAILQRARKDMAQPKPTCKTEPIHKTDASAAEVKKAEDKNVVAGGDLPLDNVKIEDSSEKVVNAQEPTEPVAPQLDGANKSLVAKLKQFLSFK
ncbi:hypothetical protein N665_0312s0022 [Sinapis alba]|nr:hypothetical protein N665_0312s0022 [Sinapis alba]